MKPTVNALTLGVLLLIAVLAGAAPLAAQNNSPYWHITTLYAFTGNADGAQPYAGVVLDPAGNAYGTTTYGGTFGGANCGSSGCGVAFKVDTRGHESLLHGFTGPPDGATPYASVARDSAGRLYGQTSWGGSSAGAVYELQPTPTICPAVLCPWNEGILYNFPGGYGQVLPGGAPIVDSQGNVYSTTTSDGAPNCDGGVGCGTVFKVDPHGIVTILHTFLGGSDGAWPMGPLWLAADGSLYGTTWTGGGGGSCGNGGCGTVFKIDSSGNESILYSFTGGADEQGPLSGVIADEQGNLYGTTAGSVNCTDGPPCGAVFELMPTGSGWSFRDFYFFQGGPDGSNPWGGLLLDGQGNLYGTTGEGGVSQFGPYCGTVYKLDSSANKTTLWNFTCGSDGGNPLYENLVMDGQGSLYGTTAFGGDLSATNPQCTPYGCGVVFKLTP